MSKAEALATPVVLIAFNRPEKTKQVLERIKLAAPKQLFVVSDGPRTSFTDDQFRVDQVRELIKQVNWDCEVKTKYASQNLGCRENVVQGLDWVFSQVPEAIILEDDCVPEIEFFDFASKLLAKYRDDVRVGSISGTNQEEIPGDLLRSRYWFSRYPEVWGWATWKRVWDMYEPDLSKWDKSERELVVRKAGNSLSSRRYWRTRFGDVAERRLDTWDHQLAYLFWNKDLLTVIPANSFVENIGFGADATHTFRRPKWRKLQDSRLNSDSPYSAEIEPWDEYDHRVVSHRFKVSFISRLFEVFVRRIPRKALIKLVSVSDNKRFRK
jgi:hypothetical protein